MMKALLNKEFKLSMHPTVPIMILLSAMVLIPNYPYSVAFFYTTLATFFTCLTGRENNDVAYTLMLPVAKGDVVKGRIAFTCIQQIIQIVVTIPFIMLSGAINPVPNAVGMNANFALIGIGFIVYGVWNAVFFTRYYKNITRVGSAFIFASVAIFLITVADIVCCIAVPFVRDNLDVALYENLPCQLAMVAVCAVFYALSAWLTYRRSVKLFVAQDL